MSKLKETNYDHLKAQWHPTKNGELKFTDFTPGSHFEAWWLCIDPKCGCRHEWKIQIKSRTNAKHPSGCPFCSQNTTRVCHHNSLASMRPDLMQEWDYNKNVDIDPNTLPVSSGRMVSWKCPHTCPIGGCKHEWDAKIANRTKSDSPSGCPFCAPVSESLCYHQSLEYLYPDLMKQWHKTMNEGIDPGKLRPSSGIKVYWSCSDPVCNCIHEWPAKICSRTNLDHQSGCPFCNTAPKRTCIHNSLEYKHPEISAEWNHNKNGDLKPSVVPSGSGIMVWWTCSNNSAHEWKAVIGDRTAKNSGCPHCKHKTEAALFDWLVEQLPDYTIKPQKTFSWCCGITSNRRLRYDFYIVELNRIIELDGPQHFEDISNWKSFKETRKKDIHKMKCALEHDIPVIRITQVMFKERKADMKDILLPHILDEKLQYVFLCEDNEYRTHKAMLTKTLKNT